MLVVILCKWMSLRALVTSTALAVCRLDTNLIQQHTGGYGFPMILLPFSYSYTM